MTEISEWFKHVADVDLVQFLLHFVWTLNEVLDRPSTCPKYTFKYTGMFYTLYKVYTERYDISVHIAWGGLKLSHAYTSRRYA